MRIFFLLFLFCEVVFASRPFESLLPNVPVNIITGACRVSCEDARIDAPLPLILSRTFSDGNWSFVPHGHLILVGERNKRGLYEFNSAYTAEPNGVKMVYKPASADLLTYEIDWEASSEALAYRFEGWSKQRLVRISPTQFILYTADGIRRLYKWIFANKERFHFVLTCEEYPNGCATYYDYDDFNRLCKIRTLDGARSIIFATCELSYPQKPGRGGDCDVRLSDGRELHYRYSNSTGALASVSGAISREIIYEKGQLISWGEGTRLGVTDRTVCFAANADGSTTHFSYSQGRTEIAESSGRTTLVHYSPSGVITSIDYCDQKNDLQRRVELSFSPQKELVEKRWKDPFGNELYKEEYFLSDSGDCIEERLTGDLRGLGERETISTFFIFSSDHRLLREQHPDGFVYEYAYLNHTNLIRAKYTLVEGKIVRRTFFEYDPSSLLIKEIEDDGSSYESEDLTDVQLRRIWVTHRASNLLPDSREERIWDGQEERFIRMHPIVDLTVPEPPRSCEIRSVDALGQLTRFFYTARGSLARILYSDEKEFRFLYGLDGRLESQWDTEGLKTSYTYDMLGNLIALSRTSKDGSLLTQESYTFRGFTLLSKTDPAGRTTAYTYDWAGRLASEETGGEQIFYSYDEKGLVSEISQAEFTQKMEYGARGRLILHREESKEGELLLETRYEYDKAGQLIQEIRGYQKRTLEYNEQGLLASEIAFNGQRLERSYDEEGNILSLEEFSPEGKPLHSQHFSYDQLGRCVRQEQGETITTYSYDVRSRLISMVRQDPFGQETVQLEGSRKVTKNRDGSEWIEILDPLGRIIEIFSSDGKVHQRLSYNGNGQLVQAVDEIARTSLERVYDAKGRLISETLPTGLKMGFEYDQIGRKKRILLPDDSSILFRYTPSRLRDVERLSAAGNLLYKHSFFDYDATGFPRKQKLIGELGELSYTLDPFGRIEHLSSPFCEFHLDHEIDSEVKKDFDQRGRLIQYETDQLKIDWCYDILGRLSMKRVIALVSGKWKLTSALYFLYDGDVEIGAMDEKGKIRQLKIAAPIRANAGDNSLVFELDGKPYAPLIDPAGNVRQLLSLSRAGSVEYYNYQADGSCTTKNEWGSLVKGPGVGNPWRLKGARFDADELMLLAK